MTVAKVKRCFPHLVRYAERKTHRKFKTKPKLSFRRHGRVGMSYTQRNGTSKVCVSSKLAKNNEVLAKAVLVHELTESLGHTHKAADKMERRFLKEKGTTYRRESMAYRRT